MNVATIADMEHAGKKLLDSGAGAALIKGGHLEGDTLVDLLVTREHVNAFRHARIDTRSTHGTGCALSAAITAGLALGHSLHDAVSTGIDYVQRAMLAAPGLGAGHGPLDFSVEADPR